MISLQSYYEYEVERFFFPPTVVVVLTTEVQVLLSVGALHSSSLVLIELMVQLMHRLPFEVAPFPVYKHYYTF